MKIFSFSDNNKIESIVSKVKKIVFNVSIKRFFRNVIFIVLLIVEIISLFSFKNTVHAFNPTTNIINGGIYYIKNKNSGLYLSVNSSGELQGTNVKQDIYNDSINQRFKLYKVSEGKFEIIPLIDLNMRFYIPNSNSGTELKIDEYQNYHSTNIRFKILCSSSIDESFYIQTCISSYCKYLSVYNNSNLSSKIIQKNYDSMDYNQWYFEGLTFNSKIKVSLNCGESRTFSFLVPDNKAISVETMKCTDESNIDKDTYLVVNNLSLGTLEDDDSGNGCYSLISFFSQEGRIIEINVSFFSTMTSGSVYLEVRYYKASLYGFNYPPEDDRFALNTLQDLVSPYNDLISICSAYKYENKNEAHFTEQDDREYMNGNSEIIFFTGHGVKSNGVDGAGIAFYDHTLYIDEIPDLSRVKIAIWSACNTAYYNSNYSTSFVNRSVYMGAKAALGFPDTVLASSSRYFTNFLFSFLCEGYTISSASSSALSVILLPWDNVRNYVISGNNSTRLLSYDFYDEEDDFVSNYDIDFYLNSTNFITYKFSNNYYRCYAQIEGLITNSFIDFYLRDNKIVSVKNHIINFEGIKILDIDNSIIRKMNNFDEHYIIYYIENGVASPIYIRYYELNDKLYSSLQSQCINLCNGKEVPYESFAFVLD